MKNFVKHFILASWILIFAAGHLAWSQSNYQARLAIIPMEAVGVEPVAALNATSLLTIEISKNDKMHLIPESKVIAALNGEKCLEIPCAIELGQKLKADQVVYGKLMSLKEKVIFQYTLIDVEQEKVLVLDQIAAENMEDLDTVMKRVARSLSTHKSAEETVDIESITAKETKTPRRQGAYTFKGVSYGYLYPQHGYDDADRPFTIDFQFGAEMKDYAVGAMFAIRKGVAMNVFTYYFLSKVDISPYIGGGLGFHWVSHKDRPDKNRGKDLRGDGMELSLNSGVFLFRTFRFKIAMNLAYTYTFNDYRDQAAVFTVGLLH